MSQSHSDTAFRNTRQRAKDLSTPQLRRLRKELLLVRADVERVELVQATYELRQAVTHFSWLKFLIPGFGGISVGKGSKASLLNAGTIGALLKQYPFISSIASMVLAKPLRATVVAGAKPALKWGSLGLAAWEAYRIWRQMKHDSATVYAAGSPEAADSESNGY
jgi:hypothetical protein